MHKHLSGRCFWIRSGEFTVKSRSGVVLLVCLLWLWLLLLLLLLLLLSAQITTMSKPNPLNTAGISPADGDSTSTPSTETTSTGARRVAVACKPCVASKIRCDKARPCSNCRRRGLETKCCDRESTGSCNMPKNFRIRAGFQACGPCVKAKIRCDTSRPCHMCRQYSREKKCIDKAVEVSSVCSISILW